MEGIQIRDHVYLSFDKLQEVLGLEGEIIRVWAEPETDYLHVLLTGTEDQLGIEGGTFKAMARGGYCEARDWKPTISEVDLSVMTNAIAFGMYGGDGREVEMVDGVERIHCSDEEVATVKAAAERALKHLRGLA